MGPQTNIHHISINNARGGSINFGPSIHKGHQANSKFITEELIIGDEFNFGCPQNQETNNDNNGDNGNDDANEDENNEKKQKRKFKPIKNKNKNS